MLHGLDQWAVSREFNDMYAGHVMRWFDQVEGRAHGDTAEALAVGLTEAPASGGAGSAGAGSGR